MDHTIALIQKSHEGDDEARAQIVEENTGLVWCIVRRFAGRGTEMEDLFQIGSIGLMKFGDGTAVLKKFFVYEPYRGAPCHLGRQLYGTLLDYARTHGVKQLILDTPKNTDRAHKFYERAGFTKIERADVPVVYDFPYEDSDFFRLEI